MGTIKEHAIRKYKGIKEKHKSSIIDNKSDVEKYSQYIKELIEKNIKLEQEIKDVEKFLPYLEEYE